MLHQVERSTSLAGLVIDPGATLAAMQFEAKAAFRSPPPGSRLESRPQGRWFVGLLARMS